VAEKHDGRKSFLAKVSGYLGIGIGVIMIQKAVLSNIDIVSPIGDCLLPQANRFATHQ
jgi:hypothetical protein